jgi:hypothetical protein
MVRDGEIKRVAENKVDVMVKNGYTFTQKSNWKTKVRDIDKNKKTDKPVDSKEKESKKKK